MDHDNDDKRRSCQERRRQFCGIGSGGRLVDLREASAEPAR